VRDLLQEELGVRLEKFSSGRDRGIDLRYSAAKQGDLVVQCKHYGGSPWSTLLRELCSDSGKLAGLKPRRYLLATSAKLSPERKDRIVAIFSPFCKGPSDVFGPEDLNGLIAKYPEIEKRHYKLWLTSVAVLERVLHADVFATQAADLESLRRRMSRFVMNPSVPRASQILSENHFCLITGVPGIGKTTLAEILTIEHLERGYECFHIWDSLDVARRVIRKTQKQLFYFDDFLGKTGLRTQYTRNEDEKLVRFIDEVVESRDTRLVLTTREYILNQAREVMEALRTARLDIAKCLVDLKDYAPRIRAHILYNHLYYSGIPVGHITALVRARAYRQIVRHRNYSPRIISVMTDALNVRSVPDEEYPKVFLENLDNPSRLWEVAFQSHLTVPGRNLLLVLCSLPDQVQIEAAQTAFEAFHDRRASTYHQARSPYDFERAVKELEGNFVSTHRGSGSFVVEIHNPSVRDFLEAWLRQHEQDVGDLLETAVFNEQVGRLTEIVSCSGKGTVPIELQRRLARRFEELFWTDSIRLLPMGRSGEGPADWLPARTSPVERLVALRTLALQRDDPEVAAALEGCGTVVLDSLAKSEQDRAELCLLLVSISRGRTPMKGVYSELYNLALRVAFQDLEDSFLDLHELEALAEFVASRPDSVPHETITQLREAFDGFADGEFDFLQDESDPGEREAYYENLAYVADLLGTTLPYSLSDFGTAEESDEIEPESPLPAMPREDDPISDRELDSLFESLADDAPESP